MTLVDQLRIAQKIAMAVLQFRSTPWLKEQWELEHLGLFQTSTGSTESALRTLHLSADFPRLKKDTEKGKERVEDDQIVQDDASDLEMQQGPSDSLVNALDHDALLYGVENVTLCSLGIALLQIGHRKPLESLRQPRDPNNVYTARRLAKHGTAPLGPKYKAIVQKCLGCDFRSGSDLEKTELQSAVYTDVICGLEDIIRGLGAVSIQDLW